MAIIYLIILLIVFLYTFFKYDKEHVNKFTGYNRQFIGDYDVEIVDYLMHKKITNRAFVASILNMIYKKNINVSKIKNDYKFVLLNNNLSYSEKKLCDLLFNKIGDSKSFTIRELENYISNDSTCNVFISDYDSWKLFVTFDASKEQFFEKGISNVIYSGVMFIVALIIFIIAIYIKQVNYLYIFVFLFSFIFMIYDFSISKRTKKGVEHYNKWIGFKNFLKDFGNFKNSDLEEHILWGKYLSYSVVFDINKQVSKTLGLNELEKVLEVVQATLERQNNIDSFFEVLNDDYLGDEV